MRTDEAWRHECEVRWVISLAPAAIKAYLMAVEKKRGAAAAERLRQDARAAWEARSRRRASTATPA
ncbi:DUF7696 family protein [Cupriavidus taiwanensis]|uniref:Uncharacterized protein n=1 Tax=Cupriavidus taiwanensis TaxID=164546 RepID=A0A375IY35_9BURK|nr:conserved hypothetical protein [Cupriavidus taiwanensis]